MNEIPSVAFQILAPSEGVADGSLNGLWFKVKSYPHPTDDLIVGLRVCASDGSVRQSGVIVISKHENHSSEFFSKQWKVSRRYGWRSNPMILLPN